MANSLSTTLDAVLSYMMASGRFRGGAKIGEPKEAPPDWYGALIMDQAEVIGTTLSGTIERRVVIIRVYHNMLDDPEQTERDMATVHAEIVEDLLGEYDLGASVRNVDPTGLTAQFAYVTVGSTMYRVMDLRVPVIVDDSASFAA